MLSTLWGCQRNTALLQVIDMIPVYENGENSYHIKYWDLYEFASVRRPHLGLIVAELESPYDCVYYNYSSNF